MTVQNKTVRRHGVGEEEREKVHSHGVRGARDHTSEDAGLPCPSLRAAPGGREKVHTHGLQGARDHTSEDAGLPCPSLRAAPPTLLRMLGFPVHHSEQPRSVHCRPSPTAQLTGPPERFLFANI